MSFKNPLLTEFTDADFKALQKRYDLEPKVIVKKRGLRKLEVLQDVLFFAFIFSLLALLASPIVFAFI
tara:strand:+ start:2179 stop:2382 length:204 start_codon:yes stop_codon:yes gene_type:complete